MNQSTELSRQQVQAGNQEPSESPTVMPLVDVVEDAGGITLYADLPGVRKDHLELQVDGDSLTIQGEVTLETPESLEPIHAEVNIPSYRRVFKLSRELDANKVSASFNQGVLTLRIPKVEHAQARRIQVQVD